jgi:spore germination cell wall hydrolase CwlJ-like protein
MKGRRHSHRPIYILLTIIIILGFAIIGNQNEIMMMQTDTLNKLNAIDAENEPVEEVDIELIQRVVAAEARGESLQGQMAVAQTILDRSELWGMTPTEVVLQEGQYADPYNGEIPDSVKLAVANVFGGGVRVFPEATTHFNDDSIPPPDWTENKINRGSIGRLSFWY